MQSSLIDTATKMSLTELLEAYEASRECSPRYRESLRRTVRKAQANGLLETCQLTAGAVNAFLSALSVGPTTRANIRRELLTLWRYAYEEGVTNEFPARVTRIRPAYSPPQAWSLDDLARMVCAAEADLTPIGGGSGLRVCDILPAWICIAYDSGLRFSDVLSLSTANFRNSCVCVTAKKTGKPLVRRLAGVTEARARVLLDQSPDGTLFEWAVTRRRAVLTWRSFLDRHGFSGSSKWLRRSCATYVERQQPGAATRYLQHSHPMLAPKHYLDQSLFDVPAGPPPIPMESQEVTRHA